MTITREKARTVTHPQPAVHLLGVSKEFDAAGGPLLALDDLSQPCAMTRIRRDGLVALGIGPLQQSGQFIACDQGVARLIPTSVADTHPMNCVFFVVVVGHGTL